MKQSTIWGFQRAGIICLNTYLIFSLNFVAIFAHGTPDRISDNIHSSHRQRYTNHRQHPPHQNSNPENSKPVRAKLSIYIFFEQYLLYKNKNSFFLSSFVLGATSFKTFLYFSSIRTIILFELIT